MKNILQLEVEVIEKKKKRNKTNNKDYKKSPPKPYHPHINPILVGSELKKKLGEQND